MKHVIEVKLKEVRENIEGVKRQQASIEKEMKIYDQELHAYESVERTLLQILEEASAEPTPTRFKVGDMVVYCGEKTIIVAMSDLVPEEFVVEYSDGWRPTGPYLTLGLMAHRRYHYASTEELTHVQS